MRRFRFLPFILIWFIWLGVVTTAMISRPMPKVSPDTDSYFKVARLEVLSKGFWSGRSPVVPFVWKLAGMQHDAIALTQWVLYALAWSGLACAACALFSLPLVRFMAFSSLLGLSLLPDIQPWSNVLRSESITLSSLALFLAVFSVFWHHKSWRFAVPCFVTMLLFALAQESNIALLLGIGCFSGLVFTLAILRRTSKCDWKLIYVAAISVLLFVLVHSLVRNSQRWKFPHYNMLCQRILTEPHHLDFFVQRGMPVNETLMNLKGQWAYSSDFAFWLSPDLRDYRIWAHEHALSTYAAFLLMHPLYTLKAPLHDFPEMYFPVLFWYFADSGPWTGAYYQVIRSLRAGWFWMPILSLCISLCTYLFWTTDRRSPSPLLWVFIPLVSISHFHMIWHADAMEHGRHALVTLTAARISLLMGLFYIAEVWLTQRKSIKPPTVTVKDRSTHNNAFTPPQEGK